jgi:hypothetical protein
LVNLKMAGCIAARLIIDDPAGLFAWSHDVVRGQVIVYRECGKWKKRPWIGS